MTITSPSSAEHPGWLVVDPAGYACEWQCHDPAADVDTKAVWARISAATGRVQLHTRGYAIVRGGGEQLHRTTPIVGTAHQVSA